MGANTPLTIDASHDWSGSGRGFHIDFGVDETLPLEEGTSSSLKEAIVANIM
jgi:hypothetical protein